MYNVYVLRSLRNNKRYVGYTSKSADARLREHNAGTTKFTSGNIPYIIIYFESFELKKEAIVREKFLKSGQGRKFLDLQLNKPL